MDNKQISYGMKTFWGILVCCILMSACGNNEIHNDLHVTEDGGIVAVLDTNQVYSEDSLFIPVSESINQALAEMDTFDAIKAKSDDELEQCALSIEGFDGLFTMYKSKNDSIQLSKFYPTLKAFQIKQFPLIRQRYKELLSKNLWQENIKVDIAPGLKNALTFKGLRYLDHAHIKADFDGVKKYCTDFRFAVTGFNAASIDKPTLFLFNNVPADSVVFIPDERSEPEMSYK